MDEGEILLMYALSVASWILGIGCGMSPLFANAPTENWLIGVTIGGGAIIVWHIVLGAILKQGKKK